MIFKYFKEIDLIGPGNVCVWETSLNKELVCSLLRNTAIGMLISVSDILSFKFKRRFYVGY